MKRTEKTLQRLQRREPTEHQTQAFFSPLSPQEEQRTVFHRVLHQAPSVVLVVGAKRVAAHVINLKREEEEGLYRPLPLQGQSQQPWNPRFVVQPTVCDPDNRRAGVHPFPLKGCCSDPNEVYKNLSGL